MNDTAFFQCGQRTKPQTLGALNVAPVHKNFPKGMNKVFIIIINENI